MSIFILSGHRKSGTSLLSHLLDGHPSLLVFPEDISLLYAYLPKYASEKFNKNERLDRIKVVLNKTTMAMEGKQIKHGLNFNFANFYSVFSKELENINLTSANEIITAFSCSWRSYTETPDSIPVVIKETSQTINGPTWVADNKNIKFVHLVRDPRDNYAAIAAGVENYYSKMGESRMQSLASMMIRSRMDLLSAYELTKNELNKNWFFALRFEDLVTSPEDTLSELCSWMGIKYDSCLEKPTILGVLDAGNSHDGVRKTTISKANVGRWHERILPEEVGVIEFFMSDVMKYWGYELESESIQSIKNYSSFYSWFNLKYFFFDSFSVQSK